MNSVYMRNGGTISKPNILPFHYFCMYCENHFNQRLGNNAENKNIKKVIKRFSKCSLRTHPDNDFLRHTGCHNVFVFPAVRVERDNQHEVALVGVWSALFAHVVGGCLAEVKPTHCHFVCLFRYQIHPGRKRKPI